MTTGLVESYRSRRARIEGQAEHLRLELWNQRENLFDPVPIDPVAALDPGIALWVRGFDARTVADLGEHLAGGRRVKVAGMVDPQKKTVSIAAGLTPQIRLFTAAHELGHVVLHSELGISFRDVPMDGPSLARDEREKEADWYAAAFLMPAQLVTRHFKAAFGRHPFKLNEGTAYALAGTSEERFRAANPTPRDLSRALALAHRFNGEEIPQLARTFGVSATTMAIRLEDLGLVSA